MKGSIRQRSPGAWEITLDLGRSSQGRRLRRSITLRGTKTAAQKRMRELLSTLDQGIAIPKALILRNWLHRWLAEIIVPNRRQATAERYRRIVELHIEPAIGHLQLDKVAPSHIHALEASLTARGMSPAGVGLVHAVLSGALKHALRMELIARNPATLVSPPTNPRRETIPPDTDTVRSLLALADAQQHHLYPCIRLIAYTGLRRGEALGLRWDHVDLDDRYLRIDASLVRSVEKGLLIQPPKTESGRRRVDLDEGTVWALRRHQDQQLRLRQRMGSAYVDNGIVFAGVDGGWTNPMALTRAVAALGRAVGCEGVTVRSLRHFHASVVLQQGQSVVVVSKRLGHSNVSITTDVYAHALPGWQRQAADAFAKAMEG